ncbi:MAG: alpha/beta hydrolase [Caulobacterales bacterium]
MSDAAPPAPPPKKQAVVLIHGIGEQRPMTTLWQLVDLVWTHAPRRPGAPPRAVYSEPDEMSGVFELRRLSTNQNAYGKRTDFFEYYWAHLMHGNEWRDVLAWLSNLATRRKAQVPPPLQKAWMTIRTIGFATPFFLFVFSGGAIFTGATGHGASFAVLFTLLCVAFIALIALDQVFVSPVLGDAARYLRPTPKNIGCRQEIRARGLKLLEALHDSGKYDRIVLVGHSLGGVIAYELVCHFWGRRHRDLARGGAVGDALEKVEQAGLALLNDPASESLQDAWRDAQSDYSAALRDAGTWLVSDLVTLGSPIAHADTVIASDPDDFEVLKERRELLAAPPWYEVFHSGRRRFSYCRQPGLADDPQAEPRAPHNSAAFAAVRWTNIYFPMQGIMRGDLIGGPASRIFGPGVKDIAARTPRVGGWFPHLDYFRLEDEGPWGDAAWADHRVALRDALGLETAP